MPGRSPIITASFLAFPGTSSYRRICRALFGSASEKSRASASRRTSQTYTLCSTTKGGLSQRIDFASTRIQATTYSSPAPYGRIGGTEFTVENTMIYAILSIERVFWSIVWQNGAVQITVAAGKSSWKSQAAEMSPAKRRSRR